MLDDFKDEDFDNKIKKENVSVIHLVLHGVDHAKH